ncbi:hypothetical protein [Aromatoleum evansii]|uniref:hypothetical protein n=1 Tax=Aromatoleum evansii TaxID=59406 RepID=UPI00145CEFDA|nr:hypothetical protein [Aromatoleum evansii]NMG31249.1 hypothetical protein [Aromatoleum evansii]
MKGRAAAGIAAGFGIATRAWVRRLAWPALALALFAAASARAEDLAALSAAPAAVSAADTRPAVVVLWTPGCLACRKSLGELERFAAGATREGVVLRTLVPADEYEAARWMLADRGIVLHLAVVEDVLDAPTRRLLFDTPLAYAIDRDGKVAAARGGLLRLRLLEELGKAAQGGD